MGAMDTVRELLIRIGILGGPEARGEIEATAASLKEVSAAQETANASTVEGGAAQNRYQAASEGLVSALQNAKMNVAALGDAVATGGKAMGPAFIQARDSVAALDVAISKARAAGAIVTPEAEAAFKRWDAQIAATAPLLDTHAQKVGVVGKAHGDARIQTDLWQEALGRTGRTVSVLSESTNPLVAAFGRFLAPLAAAAVAIVTFNKVAGELKERGVDISTVGDKWGSVMDTLAIALGGTSKTMSGMVSEMEKTQAAYTGLDSSQKSYASGLALMEAAQATTAGGLKLFASVADEIPPELAKMGGGLDNVGVRARVALSEFQDLNKELNAVRTTNPQLADSFVKQLTAMSSLGVGTEKYNSALAVLKPQIAAAAKDSENWATVMKAAAGGSEEAAKGLGRLTTESKILDVALQSGRALKLSDEEIYRALGPLVQKVAQDYSQFGTALRVSNPELAAVADAASKSKSGLDAMGTALKQAALDVEKSDKAYDGLVDSITKAGAASGNYRAAAIAQHAEVDKAITDLEKQKNSIKGLTDAEQSHLNNLLAIHAAMTPIAVDQEKSNKANEDGAKSLHDLYKSYADLTEARKKDQASIEDHRAKFVAGLEAELKKATEAGDAQVKALTEQHKAMEISDSEYNQSVNEIFAKESIARRAAIEAEDKANAEAFQKESEHQKKYEELAGEKVKAIQEEGKSLEEAKKGYDAYELKVAGALSKARDEWDLMSRKVKDHADEVPKLDIVWGNFEKTVRTGSANIAVDLDGLVVKIRNVKRALEEVDKAASAAFGDVTGGSSSTAPAPEPTGSAPGSEFVT